MSFVPCRSGSVTRAPSKLWRRRSDPKKASSHSRARSSPALLRFEPAFDESLEITYLAVHADHRRSGFGGLLVHAVAELARARDIPSVCLLTLGPSAGSTHQAETISFYRAIGFWRAKEFYLRTWGGAPTLLMVAPVDNLL
jgi:GNAT superfamily N-acetyltransferase